ncbi:MAG: hypothetical protein RhofKO_05710 [Rhodothermales bacterium]
MIRQATPSDLPDIERLWLALTDEMQATDNRFQLADDALTRWRNDVPHWLDAPSHRFWVAEVEQRVVGFTDAEVQHASPLYADVVSAFIHHLYIEPAHRRSGFAQNLVEHVRHWGRARGCVQLQWRLLAQNEGGRRFWTAVGGKSFSETWTCPLDDTIRPQASRRPLGFR